VTPLNAGGKGTQFRSGTENACTLPGCTTAAVTVTKPITVTVAGEAENPYVGLTVYAFDGSTYSGYSAVTDAGGKVVFTLPLGSYRFRADFDGVPFWSGTENTCTLPTCISDKVTLPGGTGMQEVSIDYTYDALNRLTSATYSNGTKFAYTYDAAGNVLTYAVTHYGLATTTTYTYDEANQLLSANDAATS
jgi:YD repeat-containing protein